MAGIGGPCEEDLKQAKPVDGVIVLEVPGAVRAEHRAYLQAAAEKAWPDRKVIILTEGIRVSRDAQLQRIEEKLDRLLDARYADGGKLEVADLPLLGELGCTAYARRDGL